MEELGLLGANPMEASSSAYQTLASTSGAFPCMALMIDEMFHPQSELRSTTTYCSWAFSDSLFTLLRGSVGACMMFRMRRCQGG